jgi:hypothetical protein
MRQIDRNKRDEEITVGRKREKWEKRSEKATSTVCAWENKKLRWETLLALARGMNFNTYH